jgi:peroxiredoxin Q/BCP
MVSQWFGPDFPLPWKWRIPPAFESAAKEARMARKTLRIGDPAPDFELTADDGRTVKLSDFRGKRVVVYFYPKDDTPGCTTQACGFRDSYPAVEERNAVVLGISPDGIDSHRKFKAKHGLPFRLLVDAGHKTAEAYGVWGGAANIRSHFVVGEDGRLADVRVQVAPAESVQQALQTLGTMKDTPAEKPGK